MERLLVTYFAEELTSPELGAFITAQTVGVLPVAAIEPHGPHLPLSTDCDIARGHLTHVSQYVPEGASLLILPMQTVGHSIEHYGQPGAFSHDAETLLTAWRDVAMTFHKSGGRRLIIVSSHGGNSEIVGLLASRLRVELGMLVVSASWLRFGQPEGLFDADELAYGIHGGAIETSLMLHYWPETVRRDQLADFRSAARDWDSATHEMRTHGKTRPGWMTADLNPLGALGNALNASAEKGARSAEHALKGFGELVADVAAFDLKQLRARP
jgi:creatinine amidohydrolase